MEQIFQIPFELTQTMMIVSGFVALSFLLPAVCLSYQSEILTTQIKMLQLADFVDERKSDGTGK